MSFLRRLLGRSDDARATGAEQIEKLVRDAYGHAAAGEQAEALRLFKQALEHDPECVEALYFLASAAGKEGRYVEAIHTYQKAIEARPNDAAFWFALGGALFDLGRHNEAIPAFRGGIELQPGNVDMAGSMWMALLLDDQEEEARLAVEQARDAGLESAQIDTDLGAIYRDHGRVRESIEAYARVVARVPHDAPNHSNLLFMQCYDEDTDAATLYAEHQKYSVQFARPYLAPPPDRAWPRRLRIGYVSGDFRRHVVAFFIEPILEHHDRGRFEVFCYYNHRIDDSYTASLRAKADHWVECDVLSDAQLADRIREDRIDILVDLSGHTAHNRMLMFAMKPAPVQVTYLGYPSTTGLGAIDYRITDARADPPGESDRLSAERLVRLPECFHCFRPRVDSPDVGPLPALAAGQVTFGCFNNFTKISDGFLDAAARVLAAVPGSRLLLKGKALSVPYVAELVRARFARAGVDASRLVLSGWKRTLADHLAAYNSVDIALDSFPYNGTTTTCEALWMGVPVVTLVGDRHAARVGHSLLRAVGLEEFVTNSVEQYVGTCAALAKDLPRLGALRAELRERVRRSPLTDEKGFTAALERQYLEMWETALRGDAAARGMGQDGLAARLARGAELRAAGKAAEALDAYKQVLAAYPDHAEALTAVWDLSFDTGNPGSAIDWLNKAIAARGDVAAFHYMLGCSFQAQRKMQDAAASFRRALELDPAHAKACNNLGATLEELGDAGGAMDAYVRAAELDPRFAMPLYNRGNLYRRVGDYVAAAESMGRALELEPRHADWHSNLGDMLYQRLRLDEAIASYDAALALDPGFTPAWSGRGLARLAIGRTLEAEADFRGALERDPKFSEAASNLLLGLHYARAEERPLLLEEHRRWGRVQAKGLQLQAARSDKERGRKGRLRIGYLSPDFVSHPVARFIEPVLAAHDRSKVLVIGYSNAAFTDATTARFLGLCEEWRDISRVSDTLVAERMRFDGLDILVDLAGHTGGGRPLLLARKPAPIQVTWLGYPDTTGLDAVDYRLTDARADPPGDADRYCSEKLVRLPRGFLCFAPDPAAPEVAPPPSTARGAVTFGSFNNLAKVVPSSVALWARLLHALPESKLLLKAYGLAAASARSTLLGEFARHGIGAERLELLGPEANAQGHLARYAQVDIALDSFPYNGTTTTCEALWMGVPVVSLAGTSHASRVGASLLAQAGLDDLVANDAEAFLRVAIGLANDPGRRRELRQGLRARLRASPLLDAAGFTRSLESAYSEMWRAYAEWQDPQLRLHIGGQQKMPRWKIVHAQPGPDVDYVADAADLGSFGEAAVDEIYAANLYDDPPSRADLGAVLRAFQRALKPGGTARVSVPDAEALEPLLREPGHTDADLQQLLLVAYGPREEGEDPGWGQGPPGLTFAALERLLREAGFASVERVRDFGLFHDASRRKFNGLPLTVNVVARR